MMTTFERLLVNLSTLVVAASGTVYGVMKYVMATDDPFAVVNHPLQPWMLDLHVLAAPLMIFALGFIIQGHILAQFRKGSSRTGRGTGLLALASAPPMVATGYLIQVFTDDTARKICVAAHLATGALYVVGFIAHLVVSWRIALRRRANGVRAAAPEGATAAWERRRVAARPAGRPERRALR